MLPLLAWYLAVQICGIIALPIAWRVFARLPDGGYSISKHLGILLAGAVSWFASAIGLLSNDRGGAWLSLALVAGAGLAVAGDGLLRGPEGKRPLIQWLKACTAEIMKMEALFLAAFLLWAWVRSCDPAISHTEQPMDLMYLSSVHTSPVFPPRDAWLAGYPVAYYYAGYWLLSLIAFLSAQPVELAYNLGQASWFALLMLGCYGVGINLVRTNRQMGTRPIFMGAHPGQAAGLLSAAAVALVGSLEIWLEWLSRKGAATGLVSWFGIAGLPASGGPPGNWWWWRSSRILRDQDILGRPLEMINEFPFFSYLLGDNHPHLLSMPFLLLLLVILFTLISGSASTGDGCGPPGRSPRWNRVGLPPDTFIVLAITLAMLALVNTWDLLPGVLLSLLTFVVWRAKTGEGIAAVLRSAFSLVLRLGAAILVLVWPFLITAQSQVTGIVPSILFPTRFSQFALMYGALIPGLCVLFLCARKDFGLPSREFLRNFIYTMTVIAASLATGCLWAAWTTSGRAWLVTVGLPYDGRLLAEVSQRWVAQPFTVLFLGLAFAAAVSLLARSTRMPDHPAMKFALILGVVGILLLCLPELFFLRDSFGTRMNTVFKLYYQAWPLLALAGAYGISCGLRIGGVERGLAAVSLIAIAVGLAYPVVAIPGKIGGFRVHSLTLNGIGHWSGDELASVRWIRANARQDAIVAEGVGESYRPETNRISAATGRATLLGWRGHEVQWRGEKYPQMSDDRELVLRVLYTSASGPELSRLLRSQNIDFLYLGPAERSRYQITESRERAIGAELLTVFQNGTVKIFRPRS